MTASTGSVVKNHSDLSPAMRDCLAEDGTVGTMATLEALERRGLITLGRTLAEPYALTEEGKRVAALIKSERALRDVEAEQDYRAAYATVCNHCGDEALDGVGTCERHTDYRHPAMQHHRRVQGQAAVVRNSSHVITWLAHRASWRPERTALGVYKVEATEEGGALHMTSIEALLALAHELDRPVQVTWCELDGGGFLDLSVRWTEGATPMRAWEQASHPERARAAVERLLISTGATAHPMADGVTHEVHWHPLAESLSVPVTWVEG